MTTGRQTADRMEVMPARGEQLSESDRVVVEGAAFLSDADLVRVVSTPVTEERATDGSPANSRLTVNDVGSRNPDVKTDDAAGRAAPEATGKTSAYKVSDSAAFRARVSMCSTVWSAREAA